jgi:hypothetical protein
MCYFSLPERKEKWVHRTFTLTASIGCDFVLSLSAEVILINSV